MPRIGTYVVIHDSARTLGVGKPSTTSYSGSTFVWSKSFSLPSDTVLNGADGKSVLSFDFNPAPPDSSGSGAVLEVKINGNAVISGLGMTTDPIRAYQEVVQSGILKVGKNTIQFTLGLGKYSTAKVKLSDVVLWIKRAV